jgi:hypothetical protein
VSWCVPKRVPKAGKHGGEVPETVEYALLARSTGMAATAKRFSLRLAVCAPARVTRLPGSESSACVAGSHSPWPPPLAPPAPRAGCPALFVGFPAVESGEVGLAPSLRPLTQTARAVFPQALSCVGAIAASKADCPPVPIDASRISSMPAQGLTHVSGEQRDQLPADGPLGC